MRRTLLLALWLVTDLLLFLLAYALAYVLRVGWILSSDFPFRRFMLIAALSAPVWLLTLIVTRTYSLMRSQRSPRTGLYIAYASVIGTSLFALGYYFAYGLFFSRLLLIYALLLSSTLTWVWHMLFDHLHRVLLRRSPPAFPTLIIGATREAALLIRSLERHKSPLKPVGILDGRGTIETMIEGVPVLGKLDKLEESLDREHITHLVQCSDLEQSINLLSACRARRLTYLLLPSVLGIMERDERVESLEGRPVTVVRSREPWWRWFFS